jgi:hypothetical protein
MDGWMDGWINQGIIQQKRRLLTTPSLTINFLCRRHIVILNFIKLWQLP